MGFRALRGVRLPEKKQGLIRYTCLNYADMPERTRKKIDRLCQIVGGEYSAALFELMTTRRSVVDVALAHHVSEGVLYARRRRFYERW